MSACARAIADLDHFPETTCADIELAITEAVTNCIEHAYQYDETKPVLMSIELADEGLLIEISDQGDSVPVELLDSAADAFADIPDDITQVAEGGRGLGLITALMDLVEVERQNGWNVMRLKKNHKSPH